jgi:hypothetical protein
MEEKLTLKIVKETKENNKTYCNLMEEDSDVPLIELCSDIFSIGEKFEQSDYIVTRSSESYFIDGRKCKNIDIA